MNKIIERKQNGMIKVITGVRRCGKSYLLFNLFSDYLKAQGVNDEHIIKVDLEDMDLIKNIIINITNFDFIKWKNKRQYI